MLELIKIEPCLDLPSNKLNLVLFGSEHCTPCHHMKDRLQLIEDKFNYKFNFYYIDIMKNPSIANQYNITSVPTITMFRETVPIRSISYALSTKQLINFLNEC